jgi:hypothetical protein
MRVAVAGHNLAVETSDEWVIDEPWSDAPFQEGHGVYLRSVAHGPQIRLRAWSRGDNELTEEGLLGLLREQEAASGPFDEAVYAIGGLIVVAGTFTTAVDDHVVREYFVTDGSSLANAAMPGSRDQMRAAHASAMQLVGSIRFEPSI